MPVTEQIPVVTHNGNGVTTVFAYNYKILAAADMEVTVDGVVKTLTTDYSVTGVGADGGSVTMVVAPPSGTANVVLRRDMAYNRTNDYQDNGDLLAATADEDADRPIMMLQQLVADIARAMKLPVGVTTNQVLTESAAARDGKLVSFDASGNMILSMPADLSLQTVSAFIATLLDDADAATARTTLGARAVADDVPLAAGKVIVFEGTTDDAFETTLTVTDPTADRTITLPDISGTAALIGGMNNGLFDLSGASGGQIKFPATQNPSADANTLDDYEEGTFTGTFTGFSTSITLTMRYVKVGGMVTLTLDEPGGRADGTSNATTKTMTGLPSALIPSVHRYSVAAVQDSAVGTMVPGFMQIVSSTGVISFSSNLSGAAWTASGMAYIYPNCIAYPI